MNVLFIHGYSETSLGAYFTLPQRVQDAMPGVKQIVLSAFNSLDDTVTIDDLALALEDRISALDVAWLQPPCAVICHSTGALVARRWILNRLARGAQLPSHLITMAGANHGSSLAQMGKSVLGYVQKLFDKHSPTVGANVLTDLDYGSDFLLKLNGEWMQRWNDGSLDNLYAFSMGGDFVGADPALQVFWQTHEPGSDNTVRISGANLNYTIIDTTAVPAVSHVPKRPVPHLVLEGYSHFGDASGILGWVNAGDDALHAVTAALAVASAAAYSGLAGDWSAKTAAWADRVRAKRDDSDNATRLIDSTIVFSMRDESGRSIDDCVIAILNEQALGGAVAGVSTMAAQQMVAAANVSSDAIMPHSPIQNNVQQGSYSFYIDYDRYVALGQHWFYAEAALPSPVVSFQAMRFAQPANLNPINPNEFTYVTLTMARNTDKSYALYGFDPKLDLKTTWDGTPFPADGQVP